ncbi:hypothetical protein RRF57_004272 [Xylaria bambusicola]|uniref:Aminoglycoside phosphotransferase domain-containing protein n=1 Tax=Xylaria bambusicola TaxID=326684 RepID=A0AAN7UHK6_9PEZI
MINDTAVCKHASGLNGGRSCHIEHSSKIGLGALMGCANYHARIRFHDGSPSWLMRVPRIASPAVGLPASLADCLVRSEHATLKFLETTAVPAPRAFSHDIGSDEATRDEKLKVWNNVADILVELEKHPWPKAGSLCLQSSRVDISAVASDRFVVLTPQGPFDTALSYYTAFAEQYLALIADDQLYTEYPVDAYLVYRFLKDNAVQLAQGASEAQVPEKFFLKHVDDKGDYILVDENLDITGIIDWQMARLVPRREAFGPSLVTADMSALCQGKVSLSVDDIALAGVLKSRGSPELASCMVDEKVKRFFWGLALEPKWSYALPLANAILKVFGVDQEWATWREMALREYETDERLKILISRTQTE